MDWTGCRLVEVITGKVSGVPLVAGTRVPADFVLECFDSGATISEIHEDYPRIPEEQIAELLRFAERSRSVPAA